MEPNGVTSQDVLCLIKSDAQKMSDSSVRARNGLRLPQSNVNFLISTIIL